MRRWRDETAAIPMESVTRARDMRAVQEFDWAATQLGPMQRWSPSLKWSVELVLASGFPMSVRWGPDLIMIYNDAYGALLGDRHPGALGQPLREIWPEIYGELGALNQAILRGERDSFFAEDHPWRIHRYGIPEDARFTISYSPIPDVSASNGIGGVLATVFETTERVRNEKALHVLTDRLESEVEQRTRERDRIWKVSEDLLGVANFDGYFLSANPAWTNLLGWSEDEVKSLHVNEPRHPDDAAAAIAARRQLARGMQNLRIENRFRHRDGSWRWIAWTMTTDQGLIYVSGRHMSAEKKSAEELRQSDQQFRALVAGVTDYALYMLSPTGVVSSWNAGAERIKGYAADEIIGRNFSQFLYTGRSQGRTAQPHAGDRRGNGSIRGRSVAHAQGRILVLGQRGHRRHPR
jgi:PAS domain S-box-containing protein